MTDTKINALLEWAKLNGAEVSEDVQFVEIGKNNFGAETSAASSSIKVPIKMILKLSDAVKGLGFDAAECLEKSSNINAPLKLYLAKERASNGDSYFRTYIKSLPSAEEINSPYVWLADDLKDLQGSNLGSSLRANIGLLVEEWWLVVLLVPESVARPTDHFVNLKFYYEYKFYDDEQLQEYLRHESPENWTSFPAYLWASMVVKSRSFPSALLASASDINPLDLCQKDVAMLIPVVDLLNHSALANVSWQTGTDHFEFVSHQHAGGQLFNNYGRKGNEELLLAYGFCIEDNAADTVALKIKVPVELLAQLEHHGVVLPKVGDYTSSVVRDGGKSGESEQKNDSNNEAGVTAKDYSQYADGLLYFLARDSVPEDLITVFQWLVRNSWDGEDKCTPRMQLSGLNHLRQAVEAKAALIDVTRGQKNRGENGPMITTYLRSQKSVLLSCVAALKRQEKTQLAQHRPRILTLKSVYNKDVRFSRSLLVTMGVTSYADIVDQGLMDQVWLLYLIRCYNKPVYQETEPADEQYLPEWLHKAFVRMDAQTELVPAEVVQFQGLYENLVIPMNTAVPEIYNRGQWTVRQLIVSTRLMDTIGFVRGKNQECLLVNDGDIE